jgi:hypothetical protein
MPTVGAWCVRPSSAAARLRVEIARCRQLAIENGDPALLRLGALLRDEAWGLRSTFGWQDGGPWSMSVIPEAARRYREIHTVIDFMALRNGGSGR